MARGAINTCAVARHAILPLAATVLFAIFTMLWLDWRSLYFILLEFQGQHPFWFPFLDTHAVLAAIECKRIGYDVYMANPCDVLNRPHVYSPLFLELSFLPLSVRETVPAGILLSLGFFAALAAVPPPKGNAAWLLTLLALTSCMTVYGVERGNNDLLIFIAAAGAGRLMLGLPATRIAGYTLVMLAAFLKFYPITLMVLALRERPRPFAGVAVVATAALAIFLVHYRGELMLALALTPNGSYFTDFFGAVNLPRGLAELMAPLGKTSPWLGRVLPYTPTVVLAALVVSCLRDAASLAFDDAVRGRFVALRKPDSLFLAVGAVLIASCFFAGQNIDYRGIAFLFLLPGLCALGRGPDGRVFLRAAASIVFLMWAEFFRHVIELGAAALDASPGAERAAEAAFWLLRELLWWRVIGVLLGLILSFAASSEMGAMALDRVIPLRKAVR